MKKTILPLILGFALILGACSDKQNVEHKSNAGTNEIKQSQANTNENREHSQSRVITAEQAFERISSGDDVIILDVRTPGEYEQKHIPNAILMPNEEISNTPLKDIPVMDAEILVYCRSGNRSAQAVKKLQAMGYTNVYDFGGIGAWNYETQSGEHKPTQNDSVLSSFKAHKLSGKAVDESIFADYDLNIINIWSTSCDACQKGMQEIVKVAKNYADKKVQMIGVVADIQLNADAVYPMDLVQKAREISAKNELPYMNLLVSEDLKMQMLGEVNELPRTIFVDNKGNIVGQTYNGVIAQDELIKMIDTLLVEVRK